MSIGGESERSCRDDELFAYVDLIDLVGIRLWFALCDVRDAIERGGRPISGGRYIFCPSTVYLKNEYIWLPRFLLQLYCLGIIQSRGRYELSVSENLKRETEFAISAEIQKQSIIKQQYLEQSRIVRQRTIILSLRSTLFRKNSRLPVPLFSRSQVPPP